MKLKIIISILLFINSCPAQNIFWKVTNGPHGIKVNDITFSKSGIIYLGSKGQGLLKSTDDGITWEKINDNLGLININSIAFGDSGRIIVSAETKNNIGDIFITDDGGNTWRNMNLFQGKLLNYSKDTLFLATKKYSIFRSTDNGETWIDLGEQTTTPKLAWDIIKDPNNNLLVASTSVIAGKKSNLFDPYLQGVYKSNNLGQTWENITSSYYIEATNICANSNGVIVVSGFPNISGYYRSNDYGENWEEFSNDSQPPNTFSLLSLNDSVFFAATEKGIYSSKNYGIVWDKIRNVKADKFNTIKRNDRNVLFAGTSYGLLKSEDLGVYWQEIIEGFPKIPVYGLLCEDSIVYCGGAAAGIFKTIDKGNNWMGYRDVTDTNYVNLADQEVFSLADNSYGRIFAGTTDWGKLYYSDDLGETWKVSAFSTNQTKGQIWYISIDDSNYIYMGTDGAGVYVSKDNGLNIEYSGIPNGIVRTLYFDKEYNTIYAGTYYQKIFYSKNRGKSWTQSGVGLPQAPIFSICTFNGNIFIGTNNGLFASYDSAKTWNEVNTKLSGISILSIYFTKEGKLYMGTGENGILYSDDYGKNFTTFTEGLSDKTVWEIKEDVNHFLYAATNTGVNISLSPISTIGENVNVIPNNNILQNFPNPFNPKTVIKYYLKKSCFVEIDVYSIIGRKIETIVSKKQNKGLHEVSWDGGKYPSGLYVYTLKSNDLKLSKKMILLK